MTIKILGALGLLLLCVIFGAMGLVKAYKPYDEIDQMRNDLMIYGVVAKIVITRAWYNPMRWIDGKYYQKRIDPKNIYVNRGEPK